MITLDDDRLTFRTDATGDAPLLTIDLQRTLRLPEDGERHFLPPGLGTFPLRHVEDHADRLPARMVRRGGVIAPIHQAEAMWLNFSSPLDLPCAVKVAAGKINAVTGEPWREGLKDAPQDYMVVPGQPWLDGFCVRKGEVRQFVAMRLGEGFTAEEQLTGAAEHGGVQIVVYPMKRERLLAHLLEERAEGEMSPRYAPMAKCRLPRDAEMGLAPGGRMRQEVHVDRHGIDAWDQSAGVRVFVALLDAVRWRSVTGERPPQRPPSAADYAAAGLPWFDWYDEDLKALEGAEALAGLRTVNETAEDKGEAPPIETTPLRERAIKALGGRRRVTEF